MKNKMKLWFYAFNFAGALGLVFSSCEKEVNKEIPVLSTTEVTEITRTTAISGGIIIDDGGASVTAMGVCWGTSQSPTISDSKTEDSNESGNFISSLTGLNPNTTYYVRAYATNSEGTGYGSAIMFVTNEEVADADGNVYSTVVIGNQEWLVENLKTTRYNNGTPIPNVTSDLDWYNLTTGAYTWYENNEATYKNAYGALYNWHAVNTGNLCPLGWRVPTIFEWRTLSNYAGGFIDASGKLKSIRTEPDAHPRWESPNSGVTDDYGFSAFPGGDRSLSGKFSGIGKKGYWWSSTSHSDYPVTMAWSLEMDYLTYRGADRDYYFKNMGFSVRCMKDL